MIMTVANRAETCAPATLLKASADFIIYPMSKTSGAERVLGRSAGAPGDTKHSHQEGEAGPPIPQDHGSTLGVSP